MIPIGLFADVPVEELPQAYGRWLLDSWTGLLDPETRQQLESRVAGYDPRLSTPLPEGTVEQRLVETAHRQVCQGLANDDPSRAHLDDLRDRLIRSLKKTKKGG